MADCAHGGRPDGHTHCQGRKGLVGLEALVYLEPNEPLGHRPGGRLNSQQLPNLVNSRAPGTS